MKLSLQSLLFALVVAGLASLAYGLNYVYFSEHELTVFGDRIKFWQGDSLAGPVRSNACIGILANSVPWFGDWVIMSCDSDGYAGGDNWVFNAPELPLPEEATWVRAEALAQEHYFDGGDSLWAWVRLGDHTLRISWNTLGEPLDTTVFFDQALGDSAVVFFDCAEVQLAGVMNSVLILGTRGRVGLTDNVLYASADPLTGIAPAGHPEKLAVIAEGEIKVLNTVANGRENSNGQGNNQTDPNLTDIVLDGVYVALNESFTFENQNDSDSGYVCIPCGCSPSGQGGGPDDRGMISLYGGLMQYRRGYVHRSTCSSTGYLKNYRYDPEITLWDLHLFDAIENTVQPAAVDFGNVAVGETVTHPVTVFNDYVPVELENLRVGLPFSAALSQDSAYWSETVTVTFAPTAAGDFADTLRVDIPYYGKTLAVPVTGQGVALEADRELWQPVTFALAAYPNPFNARTRLTFSVPQAGRVTLELYNTLGQRVAVLVDETLAAGTHRRAFDGTLFPSGLYLARLAMPGREAILKLALIK